MKGWQTRTFTEMSYVHHRRMSTATHHRLLVPLRGGRLDYLLGCHPVWELFRCLYQTSRPPVVIGGMLRLAGFTWTALRREQIQVPPDVVDFRRKEQITRLRAFLNRCRRLQALTKNSESHV
jgi:hypothetical protein